MLEGDLDLSSVPTILDPIEPRSSYHLDRARQTLSQWQGAPEFPSASREPSIDSVPEGNSVRFPVVRLDNPPNLLGV